MTKQEFITRQRELEQYGKKRTVVWILFFFGVLIGCAALTGYIERHESEYRWIGAALVVGLFIFLLGNLGLLAWIAAREQKRFGHRCPSCHKALIGMLAPVAIASGHCGKCGESVFTD